MTDLWQDVRYGIRVLVRARGFTALTVIVLGLGIGASTTIFSAVNGVLRRPLPYRDPQQLVAISEFNVREGVPGVREHTPRAVVSPPNFLDWRDLNRTLDGVAACRPWGFVITGDGEPERVLGARVSANLFSLLGVAPLHGRVFLPDEDRVGNDSVALLSEELWRRRFGADVAAIGTTLRLDDRRYTIVGIIPAGFALPEAGLWVPLAFEPYALQQRGARALSVVARVKPGVGIDAAREDMQDVGRTLQQRHPDSNAGWSAIVRPLNDEITGDARAPLLLLFVATGAVLLVACANLANLMLARSSARRREIAVRAALGASRLRIVRQLATESVITAVAGGAAGLAIAIGGTAFLASLGPAYLPRTSEIRVDAFVLGFAFSITLLTGVAFAMLPALEATNLDLTQTMRTGAGVRQATAVQLRDFLVIAQVALALLLLVVSGLLAKSILHLQAVELGFSPANVLSMTVLLPNSRYSSEEQKAVFFRELVRRVEALPGIHAVGLVSHLPLAGARLTSDFIVEDRVPQSSAEVSTAQLTNVDAGYFRTMEIAVIRGRSFDEHDATERRPVVIVDDTLARRFWPNQNPIGQRLRLGATIGADAAWRTVVGVVSTVRSASLELEPAPAMYVPYYQNAWPTMSVVVRTAGDPARFAGLVRSEVLAVDRNQPVYNVRSLDQVLARGVAARRFQTLLLGAFAVATLALAVIGVYGLLAYAVARRTREFGIRVALGAQRRDVVAFVMRRALMLMGVGLAIGGACALTGTRLLTTILFDVNPWDPMIFVGSMAILTIAGLLASYLPARRATMVNPVVALRCD